MWCVGCQHLVPQWHHSCKDYQTKWLEIQKLKGTKVLLKTTWEEKKIIWGTKGTLNDCVLLLHFCLLPASDHTFKRADALGCHLAVKAATNAAYSM